MKFEYDPAKSLANKAKHGIDFEEAQELWRDMFALCAPVNRPGEERFLITARTAETYWTGIFTTRGSALRIISVRRARKNEVEFYEKRKEKFLKNRH